MHNLHAIDHHIGLRMMLMSNSLSPDRKIINESLEAIKDVDSLAQSHGFGCEFLTSLNENKNGFKIENSHKNQETIKGI